MYFLLRGKVLSEIVLGDALFLSLELLFPWKFFGSLIFSLAGDRWSWGNLFVKSVSPHPFQKLFLRKLRLLRFFYFHWAICWLRNEILAKWAAVAALTPASAGQLGLVPERMASIQLTRCRVSASGFK